MQKEKVVVYGMGTGFKAAQHSIKEKYDIVAYTDSSGSCAQEEFEDKYVTTCRLKELIFDKILICTLQDSVEIKYQLMYSYQIPEHKFDFIYPVGPQVLKDNQKIYTSIKEYEDKSKDNIFKINKEEMWLIGSDYHGQAGGLQEHYFAQDIWGANRVYRNMPSKHYDIGSRVDGFISHLLVFLKEVNYIDIRPLSYPIQGLNFIQGDATNLDTISDNSIESLSSFHALEHFGLGRYADAVDPDAYIKAMRAFVRVLKPGGTLYLGVPIGPNDKLVFNAHRIFRPETVIDGFKGLRLKEFAVIRGKNSYWEDIQLDSMNEVINTIPDYSCGLFEFKK